MIFEKNPPSAEAAAAATEAAAGSGASGPINEEGLTDPVDHGVGGDENEVDGVGGDEIDDLDGGDNDEAEDENDSNRNRPKYVWPNLSKKAKFFCHFVIELHFVQILTDS